MKYFKTPARLDGRQICYNPKKGLYFSFVANELLTAREAEKMHLNTAIFEPVAIPRNKVYFFFGRRFSL